MMHWGSFLPLLQKATAFLQLSDIYIVGHASQLICIKSSIT